VILAVAGGWAAMLVAYLLVDRPEQLDGSTDVGLGLGGFVALGGAVVLIVGGLRVRRDAQIRRLRSSV
jgi:membrane associated rhomboid family serine protease